MVYQKLIGTLFYGSSEEPSIERFSLNTLIPLFLLLLWPFCMTSCGQDPITNATTETQTITIVEESFVPASVTVSAGDTIFFYNEDTVPHHILTESAEGLFDNSGLFDSLVIDVGEMASVLVPNTVSSGETLFFYCDFFRDSMITPNGQMNVK